MKRILLSSIIVFCFTDSLASNFGLPIINKASRHYYVPQLKPVKVRGKSFLSSISYSGRDTTYFKSMAFFNGCSSCDWDNIVLVEKKTGVQKYLFKEARNITSFWVTAENDSKLKFPQLLLITTKTQEDKAPTEFYIANIDGSDLKRVSPAGKHVIGYDIDAQERKLILLLTPNNLGEHANNIEANPYLVDLQKISEATPMIK